jgi:hypothetical protein
MIDINTLPISGGIIFAGISWAVISGVVLGPLVADRTIEKSGWHQICERKIKQSLIEQRPQEQSTPKIECGSFMKILGYGSDQFCRQGGDELFDWMTIDPLAGQKERLRQQKAQRLERLAELAPTQCSCAAAVVKDDRLGWGLFAGTARLAGGSDNLNADLTRALHSPVCTLKLEGSQ